MPKKAPAPSPKNAHHNGGAASRAEIGCRPVRRVAASDVSGRMAVVLELKQTLLAHKGDTPVHVHVGRQCLALDDYPVKVTSMLKGELKAIPGFEIAVQ
jgi:hypothetical protein